MKGYIVAIICAILWGAIMGALVMPHSLVGGFALAILGGGLIGYFVPGLFNN